MDHDQLREALSALHDGELGAEDRQEVLAHLERCVGCREAYQRLESLAGTFFRAPQQPARSETELFVRRVMERLEPGRSRVPAGWLEWLEDRLMIPALSLSLVALLLSILAMRPESVAPADALLLVDARDHTAGEWILPPDPSNTEGLMFAGEEE